MKNILLAFFLFASLSAFSQTTYLADTAFATDAGYGGAEASCKALHTEYNSWSMNRTQDHWLADVFTVPAGSVWDFDTVILYAYQNGSTTTSTMATANLQVYNGAPGLTGTVIWGDTVTNLLASPGSSTGFTGIYKVDTITSDGGLTSNSKPIMYIKLHLSPAVHLGAGTYWLSWAGTGASTLSGPSAPYKVLPGRINPSGQLARELSGGVWDYALDSGLNVGFNMIIKAKAGLAAVPNLNESQRPVLYQNAPNPFSGSTGISFYLPGEGPAKLAVYNVIGQLITTLVDGNMSAGNHQVTFNTSNLPAGIYYYKLTTSTGTESRQMSLIN